MRNLCVPLLLVVCSAVIRADGLDDAKQKYLESRRDAAKELYDEYKKQIAEAQARGLRDKAAELQKELRSFVSRDADALKGIALEVKTNKLNSAKPTALHNEARSHDAQGFTAFGQVKLTPNEIKLFLENCKREKQQQLDSLKGELPDHMSPAAIVEAQNRFKFLSQDNVLIVPRHWTNTDASDGYICKPVGEQNSIELPYTPAETVRILDEHTALIQFHVHPPVIIEGIDTAKLPRGKWQWYFLLRAAGKRKLPAIIGDKDVRVYQAVSKEGLPPGMIFW